MTLGEGPRGAPRLRLEKAQAARVAVVEVAYGGAFLFKFRRAGFIYMFGLRTKRVGLFGAAWFTRTWRSGEPSSVGVRYFGGLVKMGGDRIG